MLLLLDFHYGPAEPAAAPLLVNFRLHPGRTGGESVSHVAAIGGWVRTEGGDRMMPGWLADPG